MSGATLEVSSNWKSLLVSTVPRSIMTVDGRVEAMKSMLTDKIE